MVYFFRQAAKENNMTYNAYRTQRTRKDEPLDLDINIVGADENFEMVGESVQLDEQNYPPEFSAGAFIAIAYDKVFCIGFTSVSCKKGERKILRTELLERVAEENEFKIRKSRKKVLDVQSECIFHVAICDEMPDNILIINHGEIAAHYQRYAFF